MLDSFRKRSGNFVFTLIILVVVAVMALYGVDQMGKENLGGGVVAKVNGDVVTGQELRQELERKIYQFKSMFGNQLDEKWLEQFQIPQKTLEEIIQMKLLTQQARKMGFQITDYELISFIRALPYFQKEGKFDIEAYNKIPNRGNEENLQRERLVLQKFETYLQDRFHLSPKMLAKEIELKETKMELEYAVIDPKELAKKLKPSAEQVTAFAKNSAKDIEVYYAAHQAEFVQPKEYKLRRLRAGVPYQAKDAQKQEAKRKIENMMGELNKNKDFATIAKTLSDDEYAKKGGEMGWTKGTSLDPALEAAVMKLEKGMRSPIVETPFGYFIVELIDLKEETPKNIELVKKDIAEKLLQEREGKTFAAEKKQAYEKIVKDDKAITAQLKKDGIEVKKTGSFSLGQGFIPGMGNVDLLVEELYQISPSKPSLQKIVEYNDNWYYVKLLKFERPKAEDFKKEELQKTTETGVVSSFQSELLNSWVTALRKKASVKIDLKI